MIRPAAFGYNTETAASNIFQQQVLTSEREINKLAQKEFDALAEKLMGHDIEVKIFEDTPQPVKPDAVFLNNWFSTHANGKVILYPMLSQLRRQERRQDLIDYLQYHFEVKEVIDLTPHEEQGKYLEGTGSLVINHTAGLVFANLSIRTQKSLLESVAQQLHMRPVVFSASKKGHEIYHTNVLMADGEDFVIANVDLIQETEQEKFIEVLNQTYGNVVYLNQQQIDDFAGNALLVKNRKGEKYLLMSERAHKSLLPAQMDVIEKYCRILSSPIPTIENVGGGSVRCMLAENYLQPKN